MRALLVVHDNESYIGHFPIALSYIASVLRKEGVDVEIWNQDMHHWPDDKLTNYLDKEKFDIIGISMVAGYYEYRKLKSLSKAINQSKKRPTYILGGHGPAANADYFLTKMQADIVVIGEGEDTIVEVIRALAAKKSLKKIEGIAYRENDTVTVNNRRKLIEDIDSIPFPAYDLFPITYYRLMHTSSLAANTDFRMPMLSGRGCSFKCNFCFRLDEGFRPRHPEPIIEEINFLQENYGITDIAFGDELLMNSIERTEELCNAFLRARLNVKWSCNGRLNYAKSDLLRLMKKSGCIRINYGVESFDDQCLKNMNKCLTTKQIVSGVEATIAAGISPILNIIFGNIGDNKNTLQKGVDFLLKYSDCVEIRTIRPVTPYPGSPLFKYAVEKGLLKDIEDFYKNKHINSDLLTVNFTALTDDEFYDALCKANKTLIINTLKKKEEELIKCTEELYNNRNANFRGFRQT
ncbi:MAG: B12-binding domain-containing radical SAM protein [Thermodesulfovibrionales bacterium]|nr:B12-binding domain-containing radical SAM protein [Thermodesulfovibrionales bacterium]